MMEEIGSGPSAERMPRLGKGSFRKSSWRLYVPLSVVVFYVALAIAGPLIMDFDPVATRTGDRLLPPGSELRDGSIALLGTDQLGRDVWALVVQGARVSVLVGATTLVIAGVIGVALGIASGYRGGILDGIIMRAADVQLAFPSILLAILIAALLGPSLLNVILTLSITKWVVFARVARSQALATKNLDYVESTRSLGATDWHLVRRCILPAVLPAVGVVATTELGLVILAEASLSFLGLGTTARSPSWGLTIANGRDYLSSAWWISAFPGIALAMLVIAFGTVGDELRDRLDKYLA